MATTSRALNQELNRIANNLMAPGKGILAADEDAITMGKRFKLFGMENNEENRRLYRQMLFTTDRSLGQYISGIILQPEALSESATDGTPFVALLRERGIIPGVCVDKGLTPMVGSEDEYCTQGMDGLQERCAQYKRDGCDFAKWRCAFRIGPFKPSGPAILENAYVLARFAAICQMNGLVPIVEPEVLSDGDHDLERAQQVTAAVLAAVYKSLQDHNVYLEGTLLKTSMVIPGKSSAQKCTKEEMAYATVKALRRTVPVAVPGIAFLSGGQSEETATVHLNAINNDSNVLQKPLWRLTFCFGRALQNTAVTTWAGNPDNNAAAQAALLQRAVANSLASQGKYTPTGTRPAEATSIEDADTACVCSKAS